jgi:hypothetical protein
VVENHRFHDDGTTLARRRLLPSSLADRVTWVIVAVIATSYFFGLTPGHVFVQDDFAAYVMHAANLVEGRVYTAIQYVPNSQAPWVSPANGYPPIYPLLLAPVYWQRGLDLHALKVVTVFMFVIFVAAFAKWTKPLLPPKLRPFALILVGLSPAFWSYRDLIASEFPYLMFSFLALLVIRRAYADLEPHSWRPGWAMLVATLLYATYGTRTIGIALPAAMALADLARFKRPSRFLILVLCWLAVFVGIQTAWISSPKGYLSVAHVSFSSTVGNAWFYAKSLSYSWENGFNKPAQAVLAFVLTVPAAAAFVRRFFRERSTDQWYLLAYLAILIAWGAQIGIRGLMPILPLYLTYTILGIADLWGQMQQRSVRLALAGSIALSIGITYVAALRQPPWQASLANVLDPSAQQMFAFLRERTTPADLLVFSKPRSIALFTDRRAASLGPEEAPDDSADFLQRSGATILIQSAWTPPSWSRFIASHRETLTEEFHNPDFQVFRIRFEDSERTSRATPPN